MQDAREDAQNQQNEIAQRILQKMGPMLVKYAADNGFGVIIDTSNPWPNGPVLWAGPAVDITKPVVELYNAQSGVPRAGAEACRNQTGSAHGKAGNHTPAAPKPQGTQHPRSSLATVVFRQCFLPTPSVAKEEKQADRGAPSSSFRSLERQGGRRTVRSGSGNAPTLSLQRTERRGWGTLAQPLRHLP